MRRSKSGGLKTSLVQIIMARLTLKHVYNSKEDNQQWDGGL
jgi:hypothetical protein